MIKIGNKGKRFLIGAAAHYLEGKLDDDEFWSSILRNSLNPRLKKIDPKELYAAYTEKLDLTTLVNVGHIDYIHKFLHGNEDLIEKVKKQMILKLPRFEWNWIDEWWKEDLPELRGIVINHPESDKFKVWLVAEIEKLAKHVQESI